jgi:hypothetical protein
MIINLALPFRCAALFDIFAPLMDKIHSHSGTFRDEEYPTFKLKSGR